MTILEMVAMEREARKRMRRRRQIVARIAELFRSALLIVAITWCFTSRGELFHLVTSIFTH